ncbi:hypothetical protein [Limosilactobacillus coleohominis]|uniref:Uncharacterized protein n=1 Tax=Limosilactobacillus coleohominis TaxID=181675 RepID=A0ABS2GXU7_9LACO|nr:hypothetical protein [Limosilactobacillus coleohominis]MBM6940174.1 hypothetical protein [Limosilactobacillus coleohominis]
MSIRNQLLQDAVETIMALQGRGVVTINGVELTDKQLFDEAMNDLIRARNLHNKKAVDSEDSLATDSL